MSTEPTIMIKDWLGEESPYTKDEFVKRWYESIGIGSLGFSLSQTSEEWEEIKAFGEKIKGMAERKFDAVLERQAKSVQTTE